MNRKTEPVTLKNRLFPFLGALIVCILCSCVLYMGDNIGLSDNGDFRRIMLASRLEYADETDSQYLFKQYYKMEVDGYDFADKVASVWETDTENEIYESPHFIFIKASKVLNLLDNIVHSRDETQYNIAWLAGIYIFMFSVAAWCIFTFFNDRPIWLRLLVFLLFVFIFCDAGYIMYFNSLYGEPLQYISLMLLISVGLMIYKRPSIPKAVCFFAALYFFAGSKLANIPYSIIAALLAAAMCILRRDKLFKITVLLSAAVSVVCIIQLYTAIPDWMNKDTIYQSVFYGILKESDTVTEDLEELGLNEGYKALANTTVYNEENIYPIDIKSEEFEHGFYDNINRFDIVFFWLRHPVRFMGKLAESVENSAYIRPPNIGNSSVVIAENTDRYSLWSNLRVYLKFLYNPVTVFFIFGIITLYMILVDVFLIVNRKKEEPRRLFQLCAMNVLVLGLWINLMLPILGNGEADLAKHLFLFTNEIDILFAIGIISLPLMKRRNMILTAAAFVLAAVVMNIQPSKETMTFGTYKGEPIEWEIFERLNDNSYILVTKDCIEDMEFNDTNNLWEQSDLRTWLNSDFLAEFTDEEKARIKRVTNEVILAYNDRGLAVSGDHPHYCNFTRNNVDDLAKTAYHYYLDDVVYIPTLDMMKDISVDDSFWILCPYTTNDKMQRYMNKDGFILRTNVTNKRGVRAVVRYDLSAAPQGE